MEQDSFVLPLSQVAMWMLVAPPPRRGGSRIEVSQPGTFSFHAKVVLPHLPITATWSLHFHFPPAPSSSKEAASPTTDNPRMGKNCSTSPPPLTLEVSWPEVSRPGGLPLQLQAPSLAPPVPAQHFLGGGLGPLLGSLPLAPHLLTRCSSGARRGAVLCSHFNHLLTDSEAATAHPSFLVVTLPQCHSWASGQLWKLKWSINQP